MNIVPALICIATSVVVASAATQVIGEDLSNEHMICLVTLFARADVVAATKVTQVVAAGVLEEIPDGYQDAERGDVAYAVTVESVVRPYKGVEGLPNPRELAILTFSACPSCNREEAAAMSVVPTGTVRLLVANEPSFPGLLGIPGALKNSGIKFDAIGGSACSEVKLDPEGANADIEAIFGPADKSTVPE